MQRSAALQLKAAVWRSVLLAGMGEACFALSAAYKAGALQRPALAGQFFGYVHEYGNCSKRYTLELSELLANRETWLGDAKSVTLEANPPMVGGDADSLAPISQGTLPAQTDAMKLYSHRLQEGVSSVLRRMSPNGAREVTTGIYLSSMRESLELLAQGVADPKRRELMTVIAGLPK